MFESHRELVELQWSRKSGPSSIIILHSRSAWAPLLGSCSASKTLWSQLIRRMCVCFPLWKFIHFKKRKCLRAESVPLVSVADDTGKHLSYMCIHKAAYIKKGSEWTPSQSCNRTLNANDVWPGPISWISPVAELSAETWRSFAFVFSQTTLN